MWNPFPFGDRLGPRAYLPQVLIQRCSCGATIQIDPTKSWSPGDVTLRWFDTHPCPNRPKEDQ